MIRKFRKASGVNREAWKQFLSSVLTRLVHKQKKLIHEFTRNHPKQHKAFVGVDRVVSFRFVVNGFLCPNLVSFDLEARRFYSAQMEQSLPLTLRPPN